MADFSNQPAPKKSGGALKWILLGCGGMVFLVVAFFAVSGYLVYRSVSTDPAKVESAMQEIVEFEKPEGYKGAFSMSVMGMKMASLASADNSSTIVLVTIPGGNANEEELRRQMNANMEKQGRSQEVLEKRAAEKFKVRGKDVDAGVQVVTNKGSEARLLQYTLTVPGKAGGPVMVMIMGPEKQTDHAWVQKFLDSIK